MRETFFVVEDQPNSRLKRERERETERHFEYKEFGKMSTNRNIATPIRNALIWINFNFNLVGIVREFTFPIKSRGSGTYSLSFFPFLFYFYFLILHTLFHFLSLWIYI